MWNTSIGISIAPHMYTVVPYSSLYFSSPWSPNLFIVLLEFFKSITSLYIFVFYDKVTNLDWNMHIYEDGFNNYLVSPKCLYFIRVPLTPNNINLNCFCTILYKGSFFIQQYKGSFSHHYLSFMDLQLRKMCAIRTSF